MFCFVFCRLRDFNTRCKTIVSTKLQGIETPGFFFGGILNAFRFRSPSTNNNVYVIQLQRLIEEKPLACLYTFYTCPTLFRRRRFDPICKSVHLVVRYFRRRETQFISTANGLRKRVSVRYLSFIGFKFRSTSHI